jgi:hypothetical protein
VSVAADARTDRTSDRSADLDADTIAFALTGPGAETCREVARALAPHTRRDGGLVLSGSAAAALAEVFRRLARDGGEVPDVAVRAARRILTDLENAQDPEPPTPPDAAPAPRAPGDRDPEVLAAR